MTLGEVLALVLGFVLGYAVGMIHGSGTPHDPNETALNSNTGSTS